MIKSVLSGGNIAVTIGISIPNVPHEVPVANARKHATRKITAGRNIKSSPAACSP